MFGRGSTSATARTSTRTGATAVDADGAVAGGKGRPTPKRSAAQAKNRQPLVPNDRKAAARKAREQRRSDQKRVLEAYDTEDQRYLPLRDRGPVRRYVRDLVDTRRNVGQYFLPVALLVLLLGVVPDATLRLVSAVGMYTMLGVLVLDSFLLSRTVKRAVTERFGAEAAGERGLRMYAFLRSTQMRRMRRPVPQVRHGQAPR